MLAGMGIAANFVIVTLGVSDVARAASFYRELGWEQHGDPGAGILWFRTSGTWIGLYGSADLAADAGLEPLPLPDYRGVSLALNLPDETAVDLALRDAVAAGARLVKPATRAEWGGYSGYFADPDGHLWEVCFNPGFPLASDGTIEIPG